MEFIILGLLILAVNSVMFVLLKRELDDIEVRMPEPKKEQPNTDRLFHKDKNL